jgi:DNA gyrase subunit A
MDASRQALLPVNIEDEMRVSYLDYAMSVIIGRALPDVRDGLKPVHRRVLFTMQDLKNNWNSSYKKSARIVGDCIGKYHPHGDQAVYDTLVRLAQDFSMRYPLVDGQGNFGSVDGDPAAAMRYTEVRMQRIAHELLADIEKDTVEFGANYDETTKEPLVLPTKVPNLLVNGSAGIAVGMATNIPPHNLGEIVDACIHLMGNPAATVTDLMEFVPGPDFPTGGTIYGRQGIFDAYHTGRGVIRIRAVCDTEEMPNDRERIVVHELPYQVNKARLLEKIASLVREKRLEGISDLRDESDRTGMRMVVELKRDAQSEIVLNQLYKLTALQSSFGINMLAIVNGEPRVLNIKEILEHFIDHRRDVTLRRCRYELRKAEARAHLLEGFRIALDHIDAVIAVIRGSKTAEEARQGLIVKFDLSERQASAILEMRLRRLTGMERDEIIA